MRAFVFQILEQFPLPLLLQNAQGDVIHQNRSWREHLGDSPKALSPQKDPQLTVSSGKSSANQISDKTELESEQQPEILPECWKLTEFPDHHVSSHITKERAWQLCRFPLNMLDAEEDEPYWAILAADVTDNQRLCRELTAKNADLRQLNRLKDEFLACISHELRSPLTAVVGLSSLLENEKVGTLNVRQAHYAHLIHQSGQKLMTLVSDLLDLTRLETGQLELKQTRLNIERICQSAFRTIEQKYREKLEVPLNFVVEIEPKVNHLIADNTRLQQILIHLLDNAAKFTESGGKFGLRVNRWSKWIAFTVWDTGIGISEEAQHLLFQKFQQLESPLTRQFEGSGLGLALARRLAQAHGGDISFRSQVGQGSQFTLLLPPAPPPHEIEDDPSHSLALIVESMPQAIDNLAEQLDNLDYCTAIARTGIEAVEKARQLRPTVIFLNPQLPMLSGWDALTLLQADIRTQKIPIFVTAASVEEDLVQKFGVRGVIPLPIRSKALEQSLKLLPTAAVKTKEKHLTILLLFPLPEQEEEQHSVLLKQLSQSSHRILQVEELDQAERISRVWQIDVVILDSTYLLEPKSYLKTLSKMSILAELPLVTLEAEAAAAANSVGLSVFPCLTSGDEENSTQFIQVIEIAAENGDR